VTVFNGCAVSDKQCVPQQATENAYPIPKDSVLDDSFDLSKFQGRWYITAGYNKLFDTFDCQEHYFTSPEEGKVFGKINWRIQKPDGDFLERSTVQRFVQARAGAAALLWLPRILRLPGRMTASGVGQSWHPLGLAIPLAQLLLALANAYWRAQANAASRAAAFCGCQRSQIRWREQC
jgi:VDE lipocalin domain